jgi:hypothetical protein
MMTLMPELAAAVGKKFMCEADLVGDWRALRT